jgi:hypothetical protein
VRGRWQGLGPLYRPAPAVVGLGARALPPWTMTLGILLSVATTTGAPHRYCRPLAAPLTSWPTVAGPSIVSHDARCTFVENCGSTIYFSKIMTN